MRTAVFLSLVLFACSSSGSDSVEQTLRFEAVVGDQAFACGTTYEGLGTENASFTPTDLRFYVYDVRLVDAEGTEVALDLADDGRFQRDGAALLDFEDGCGDMGNADLNDRLVGSVPEGTYTGVRFRVGLPPELNHANSAEAPAPRNLTAMWWSWNAGYKFVRVEGRSSAFEGWRLHLGSTACTGDMMGDASCANPNVVDVAIDDFDPTTDRIVFDLDALVATSTLGDTGGAPGCMSGPDDTDCGPIFDALGLAFGGSTPGAQRVFSAR
ncbi:MAG: metallo-mystery pair system four-Cys motif protein [Sandaracinus sp.]|nr:metallo-mystery pair system four-Cys motif protein [Sandaracinus sp.]